MSDEQSDFGKAIYNNLAELFVSVFGDKETAKTFFEEFSSIDVETRSGKMISISPAILTIMSLDPENIRDIYLSYSMLLTMTIREIRNYKASIQIRSDEEIEKMKLKYKRDYAVADVHARESALGKVTESSIERAVLAGNPDLTQIQAKIVKRDALTKLAVEAAQSDLDALYSIRGALDNYMGAIRVDRETSSLYMGSDEALRGLLNSFVTANDSEAKHKEVRKRIVNAIDLLNIQDDAENLSNAEEEIKSGKKGMIGNLESDDA